MEADTVHALVNAVQRCADVAQQVGLPVEVPDGELALGGVLNFVQSIRALFDCDGVPVTQYLFKFGLFVLQDLFIFV